MPENTNYASHGNEGVHRTFRRCREMLSEIKRLGEVVDERNVEIERLQLALNKSETACGHLEADLAEAKAEIERLTVQRNTLATRSGDLQLEIERLNRELGKVCENWRVAFGEGERLQRCNESLSLTHAATINMQNQEIERLRARVTELEAENAGLATDVHDLSPSDGMTDEEIEQAARAAGGEHE